MKFPTSYVANDEWVSGSPAAVVIAVPLAGYTIHYTLQDTTFTMKLSADRQTAQGIVAGVLPVEAFIAEMKKVAGSFSKDLCTGTTFDSVAVQLRQTADIMADGSQDPTKTCDGISLGWGFHAEALHLGVVAPPSPTQPDPCQ